MVHHQSGTFFDYAKEVECVSGRGDIFDTSYILYLLCVLHVYTPDQGTTIVDTVPLLLILLVA